MVFFMAPSGRVDSKAAPLLAIYVLLIIEWDKFSRFDWPTIHPSAVDIFSIADFDHEHAQGAVLYVADDSVVSNSVAPEGAQHRARQRLSEASWVV